jgi:muconolactone D-isomerase
MIEFLTRATISPPDGLSEPELADLKGREAQRAAELARAGRLVRAWRPHASRDWANICLWTARDEEELWAQLRSLPFFPHMTITVERLDAHPSDPAGSRPPTPPTVRMQG